MTSLTSCQLWVTHVIFSLFIFLSGSTSAIMLAPRWYGRLLLETGSILFSNGKSTQWVNLCVWVSQQTLITFRLQDSVWAETLLVGARNSLLPQRFSTTFGPVSHNMWNRARLVWVQIKLIPLKKVWPLAESLMVLCAGSPSGHAMGSSCVWYVMITSALNFTKPSSVSNVQRWRVKVWRASATRRLFSRY